jgi:Domain of unknown function (DUF5134)
MGWLSGMLAVVCLAVGLFHLARLAVRRNDVASELAHGVMGLGMAAMFSPLGNPVPGPVWTVVFALFGLWFAGAALRSRTFGGEATHHVIGSGAMLFMLAAGHAAPAADPAAPAGHAAHGGGTTGTLGMASLVALLLTGYFAWHALRCTEAFRRAGSAAPTTPGASVVGVRAPARPLHHPQLAAAAHLGMAVAMAVMLFGMV